MKALSSSIVVLSGSAILIASSYGVSLMNPAPLFWMGMLVIIAGIAGWVRSLATEK